MMLIDDLESSSFDFQLERLRFASSVIYYFQVTGITETCHIDVTVKIPCGCAPYHSALQC